MPDRKVDVDALAIEPVRGVTLFDRLTNELLEGLERDIQSDTDPKLLAYRADPVLWMTEVLGIPRRTLVWSDFGGPYATHTWDGTPDPLAAICNNLAAGRNVGVESGTGTGKTFLGGALVLWWLDCWRGSVVVTAAPKEDQLKKHLWKELGQMYPRFRRRRVTALLASLSLKMQPPGEKWAATGFPVGVGAGEEVATKAAGFHERDMLIITEETQGIKPPIMAAFEQTSVAPHNLRLGLGNPDHQGDSLHAFCLSPGVVHIRISALDHPNVVMDDPMAIPGAVALGPEEQSGTVLGRRIKYGEASPMYRSRVRGISPAEAFDSLIKLSWCHAAVQRGRELCAALGIKSLSELLGRPDLYARLSEELAGLPAVGVDVANSKRGDLAAVARGVGAVCCSVEDFPCENSNLLGARVAVEDIRARGVDPDYVGVDGVGVGAGTVNHLLGEGYGIQSIIGGALPDTTRPGEEIFLNLRAQMHWQAHLDLFHGRVVLPDNDEDLINDLITPKWKQRADKAIQVEAKEKLKERLPEGRSPNKGDAFVIWNWVRQVRAGFTMDNAAGNVSF